MKWCRWINGREIRGEKSEKKLLKIYFLEAIDYDRERERERREENKRLKRMKRQKEKE